MERIIDADAILKKAKPMEELDGDGIPCEVMAVAAILIDDAPTVDAVELPCKVGDTVYQVDANKIYPITIRNLIYDAGHIAFDENAIGKSVFLTRKEAEAKLGGDGNG